MFKRILGGLLGAAAVTQGALANEERNATSSEEPQFEMLSGWLDGTPTFVVVNYQGTAVAVEIEADRPKIVRGLAAGVILSDLRERAGPQRKPDYAVSSGATRSSVWVDGKIVVGYASRAETIAAIEALPNLSDDQKRELLALLALD